MIICILGLTDSHPGLSPNQLCSDSNPYRPTVPLTFIRYRINIMYKLVSPLVGQPQEENLTLSSQV